MIAAQLSHTRVPGSRASISRRHMDAQRAAIRDLYVAVVSSDKGGTSAAHRDTERSRISPLTRAFRERGGGVVFVDVVRRGPALPCTRSRKPRLDLAASLAAQRAAIRDLYVPELSANLSRMADRPLKVFFVYITA